MIVDCPLRPTCEDAHSTAGDGCTAQCPHYEAARQLSAERARSRALLAAGHRLERAFARWWKHESVSEYCDDGASSRREVELFERLEEAGIAWRRVERAYLKEKGGR